MNERVEFANQLRAIAALSVLVSHYFGIFWQAPHLVSQLIFSTPLTIPHIPSIIGKINEIPHFSFSAFGVSLFFLISGFVIPFSLNHSSNSLFAIRRILRIYPLYTIAFLITATLLYCSANGHGISFPYTAKQLLIHSLPGLRNFFPVPTIDGIIWTLEIEIKFYALCLLFRRWLFDIRILLIPLILFLVQTLLRTFCTAYFHCSLLIMECHFLIYMLIGTIYYLAYQKKISLETCIFSILAIFALLTITVAYIPGNIWIPYLWSQGWALLAFFAAASFPRLVNSPVLSFFAQISFPLYLIHGAPGYILMTYLYRFHLHPLLIATFATIVATLAAYALHLLFERPLLTFSKYYLSPSVEEAHMDKA